MVHEEIQRAVFEQYGGEDVSNLTSQLLDKALDSAVVLQKDYKL